MLYMIIVIIIIMFIIIDGDVETGRSLVQHIYGNYVVQHVLEHGQPSQRRGAPILSLT